MRANVWRSREVRFPVILGLMAAAVAAYVMTISSLSKYVPTLRDPVIEVRVVSLAENGNHRCGRNQQSEVVATFRDMRSADSRSTFQDVLCPADLEMGQVRPVVRTAGGSVVLNPITELSVVVARSAAAASAAGVLFFLIGWRIARTSDRGEQAAT